MAAGPWLFPNGVRTDILNGVTRPGADTFKMALFLSTSNISATSTTYAALTNEHANANGYITGGISVTLSLSGTTSITGVTPVNAEWTATGGNITARYGVIYEVGANVFCYCLLEAVGPADVTATPGNFLRVDADGVPNPVFIFA